ncbi:MAG: VRR-NUC domain-containing protein [Elstera sp.]|jgi:hypothetical protein
MARKNPEQRLQIQVANFLRLALRPPTVWTAFPAGGGGKVRGALLKAMGLKPGWPDVIVLHPLGLNTLVVGIELKAKKGRLSDAQKDACEALWAANARYVECRSLEEVDRCLRRAGVPMHAHVASVSLSDQEEAS